MLFPHMPGDIDKEFYYKNMDRNAVKQAAELSVDQEYILSLIHICKCALDAVSAGFVKRITAVNISMKILFCDWIKCNIRFFVKCM